MVGGEVLEVNLDREVVTRLGLDDVALVFAFEDLLGAILNKLLVALDVDGDEDLCL